MADLRRNETIDTTAGSSTILGGKGTDDKPRFVKVSDAGEVFITGSSGPAAGTLTDGSGTIAVASTSQAVFAANVNRRYIILQNVSADDLWFDFDTAAVESQPSFKLIPDASFVMESGFVSTEALNIIGPNAGAEFIAKEGT